MLLWLPAVFFLHCNRDRKAQGSDCGLHFHVGGEVNQTYIVKPTSYSSSFIQVFSFGKPTKIPFENPSEA